MRAENFAAAVRGLGVARDTILEDEAGDGAGNGGREGGEAGRRLGGNKDRESEDGVEALKGGLEEAGQGKWDIAGRHPRRTMGN